MMKNTIGETMKNLRTEKGYTQEKLSEILGVSAQSVSKWERSTSFPDIQLLPKIATTFGITIDELFVQSTDDELEKIENMLDYKDDVSYGEESYIIQKLEQNQHSDQIKRLKAKLYLKRGQTYLRLAEETIKNALEKDPDNKESHYIYLSTNNGVMTDWNFYNKMEIIKYYQDFVKKNPNSKLGHAHLLDHLIHDGRIKDAEYALASYQELDSSFRVDWYQSRINQLHKEVDPLIKNFKGDWLRHSIKADEYAKIGQYDIAIKEYLTSYELQPSPKYIDALESIAHIHEIKNEQDKAKEYYKKIVTNLKEEWNITFGSSIEYYMKKSH
ncbi:MAG: helix-turn-helix domain-containing protein [Candidatus Izemoplasmataceae bacterium]